MLQIIEENPARSTLRVSGKLGILQSSVIHLLHDLGKKHSEVPNYTKHYQNVAKLLTRSRKRRIVIKQEIIRLNTFNHKIEKY